MRILLSILLSTFILIQTNGQNKQLTKNDFNIIFKASRITYEGKEYVQKTIKTLDSIHPLSKITNNNEYYFMYLYPSYNKNNETILENIKDTIKLQNKYIEMLWNDSSFVKNINDFFAKTLCPEYKQDTISIDKLLNFAVKFFFVYKLDEIGDYRGKVCSGLNAIDKTDSIRNPQVEAFCFSSIFSNYEGEKFNMLNEFKKGLTELYSIKLGTNNNDILLRAQGALFFIMKQNENLKKMLLYEYEKRKDYLPFVIKGLE